MADVDGDGRNEVILGSACLDDDGTPLWTTGRGHPDGVYVGHLQPGRPGMQVFYNIETYQTLDGGLCMVDAARGTPLWALAGPTRHVHSNGICADIDPAVPGYQCYAADTDERKRSNRGWLFSADGKLLATGARYGASLPTIYWDADLRREILRDRIYHHDGGVLEARPERGKVVDLLGDWREEIISSAPGELRIYSTTLPAMDRRVCLLQDPLYRSCVCLSSMGYETSPTLSTPPSATAPNLSLTCVPNGEHPECRVVVSTPPGAALSGTLHLQCEGPFHLQSHDPFQHASDRLEVNLQPGGIFEHTFAIEGLPKGKPVQGRILGQLHTEHDILRGEVWVELSGRPAPRNAVIEAPHFSAEGGGRVEVRTPPMSCGPESIRRWNQKGHYLEWSVDVPAAGRYLLYFHYHATEKVARRLAINGADFGSISFLATRGSGDKREDWDEVTFTDHEGQPFRLDRGRQTIRLENVDGHALDLDYLGFMR